MQEYNKKPGKLESLGAYGNKAPPKKNNDNSSNICIVSSYYTLYYYIIMKYIYNLYIYICM